MARDLKVPRVEGMRLGLHGPLSRAERRGEMGRQSVRRVSRTWLKAKCDSMRERS